MQVNRRMSINSEAYEMKRKDGSKKPGALTIREHDILALLCEGLSNGEIAARLSISPAPARQQR